MTRFADQLFDDLMREHGPALARAEVAAPKRQLARRPLLIAAGGAGLAAAAVGGVLAAGGGTPAYAVTAHSNGTVTVAVYQKSGIAGANAKLRQLGDGQVFVVPVEPGCPSMSSLPPPPVSPAGQMISTSIGSSGGSVTVSAQGIPAGDIMVVATESDVNGASFGASTLTSAPAPSCVSIPAQIPTGSTRVTRGGKTVTRAGGSGRVASGRS
jgi:hypothetical protein